MSSQSEEENITVFAPYDTQDKFDYSKILEIIEALDWLRAAAKNSGHEDLYILINSAFNICFTTYHAALRMPLVDPDVLPESEDFVEEL